MFFNLFRFSNPAEYLCWLRRGTALIECASGCQVTLKDFYCFCRDTKKLTNVMIVILSCAVFAYRIYKLPGGNGLSVHRIVYNLYSLNVGNIHKSIKT